MILRLDLVEEFGLAPDPATKQIYGLEVNGVG
jgi:hypothetical protein